MVLSRYASSGEGWDKTTFLASVVNPQPLAKGRAKNKTLSSPRRY
jgi:hypothetical protein